MEKGVCANGNQKKAEGTILISDKTDIEPKTVIKDKVII